ncbi:MAG: DNA polymerase III subunit gamma/tau [Oscillospiraceae bacterium]|nr:DNA polymerase III subunit gamma/tau [Oscillospiraceae bacterium]
MYQALYRKWRPMQFPDVLSQSYITTTLQNQVRNHTTAHAYLFTGSRGTGKTTCARILAKAVNCEHPLPDGNPCLECPSCRDADQGILPDLIEIDAASNNSVEDIRDLRDAIVYTPQKCAFKIYIIDEVHMLSVSAFNALLKIMEEPPAYIKFILATTEIHKVPATIISRCQRFDFRRIQQKDIIKRLLSIAEQEKIRITEQAAALIARIADGGMRDAISLLDRCAAYDTEITEEVVSESAGTAGRDYLTRILRQLHEKDIPGVLGIISELHENSKDLQQLCEELILMQRDLMLLKATGDASLLHSMPDEVPILQEITIGQDMQRIMQILEILQSCRERMTKSVSKRTELELSCIQICQNLPVNSKTSRNPGNPEPDAGQIHELYARIAQLEQGQAGNYRNPNYLENLENPGYPENFRNSGNPEQRQAFQNSQISQNPQNFQNSQPTQISMADFQPLMQWSDILEECGKINPAVMGALAGSEAVFHANMILITAQNPLFLTLFKLTENAKSLGDAVEHVMGRRYVIRARCAPGVTKAASFEEILEKAKNSGIPTTAV